MDGKRDRDGRLWYDAAQFRAVTPLRGDAASGALAKGMAMVSSKVAEGVNQG